MATVSVEIEMEVPEGVTIRGYERHQAAHVFEVDFALPERCTCSKCGHEGEANIRFKNDVLVIRDVDLFHHEPCFWAYQPALHQCVKCRQRTQVATPFKRPHVTYTYRFEEYVMVQLRGTSCEEVARRLGLSAETVEHIAKLQLASEREIPADREITSIGMDELSLKKGHKLYATILWDLSDPQHPRVLTAAKGRDRQAAEACLAKLSPEQRAAVRSHRTDMSAVYPDVCAEKLPNSQLVVDRFHVAKQLGGMVDRVRKKHGDSS
jgi:transposase